jgi:protein-tyrosine phosphatase
MNFQLDDNVYFGNHSAPIELGGKVKTVINVAHAFSSRRGRNIYFKNLEEMPWDTFYVRLAKKDRQKVDNKYFNTIESCIEQAVKLNKVPILCHCQMGGHRGPTVGIMAAWILNGRTKECLDHFIVKATELRPRYAKSENTAYRRTMTQIMRERSI